MASRTELRVELDRCRKTLAAVLRRYLACASMLAGAVHTLDPDKRVTGYIPTSSRIQNGSTPGPICLVRSLRPRLPWGGCVMLGATCVFVLSIALGCNKKNQAGPNVVLTIIDQSWVDKESQAAPR